jgi:hypothetical protein
LGGGFKGRKPRAAQNRRRHQSNQQIAMTNHLQPELQRKYVWPD